MDTRKYQELGKPVKESYKQTVNRLTEQVYHFSTFKYSKGFVFDELEKIIKETIEDGDSFTCSKENIGKKIIAVHDVENKITSLLVGAYPEYRTTVMEKYSQRISRLIYETGMKEEIVEIMFAVLIKEMKRRFGMRNSGYVYKGLESQREEGIIKAKGK